MRMKWGMMTVMLVLLGCAATATQTSCGLLTPDPVTGQAPIQKMVQTVAPFIPGPWGAIAAAGAAALVGVGSVIAKRQVNAAHAAVGTDVKVNGISKLLAERKYVVPLLGAIPMLGKALNLWDANMEASIGTLVAAALAVGADVYESKKASTPAPPTP